MNELEIAREFYESQLSQQEIQTAKQRAETRPNVPYVESLLVQYKYTLRRKFELE